MIDFYNEILIKNIDCGVLYFQIKDDKTIEEYEKLKKEKKELEHEKDTNVERLIEVQKQIEDLSKKITTFKNKDIKFDNKDNRYRYSGTIADSLMGRKLRQVAKSKGQEDTIRTVGDSDYTDIIINLKFKSNIMIPDNTTKKNYDPETDSIVEVEGKKMKCLISKNKLRQMAYRDGITINGVHYVNYQRTSSKARIGNILFIREDYFEEMDGWQNLNIPFKELEKADIVAIRSYHSLIASSIIGELDIDPYSILLIDDVSGHATMDCNVVELDNDTNGKGMDLKVVKKPYTQYTDLWDGQSLLDSSVFEKGKYVTKENGEIKEHSYKDYGFILLRNHFFKTAVFNTNLQKYYSERFKGVENPIINDTFGNPFETKNVLMVTTRNSVKIFKFADIICEYMIADDKKTRLIELEKPIKELKEELKRNRQAVTTAKRKLTMLLNFKPDKDSDNQPPTREEIEKAQSDLQDAIDYNNDNLERLENEIKALSSKELKIERERLTWDWYREKISGQKFGCCKTEHKSKFGDKQQLWYQVIGSLNFNKDKLWQLIEPQVTETNYMKKYVAWFKRGIDMRATENVGNSMMLSLLNINDNISRTTWYTNFRRTQIGNIIKRLIAGKVQIKGSDFCTLVGNPYEMLRASCGDKIETSIINDFECYCSRYGDGEELYGMRSPHICSGNNALLKNTYRKEWKWFNFTDNILIINLWGKGAFLSPVWNGCDTDSDSAYIGNNPIILEEVKKVQDYLVPINGVPQHPNFYAYTNEDMAKVDGKLCNDFIGKICNLARDLQALYWHLYNTGTEDNKQKYLSMIYDDICLLEVLSNIAIDSAKRQYPCNIAKEMKKIKTRPYMTSQGAIIQDDTVVFVEKRYKKSLSEETVREYEELVERRNNATSKELIEEINKDIDDLLTKEDVYMVRPDFAKDLKASPKKKKRKNFENDEQKELYRQKQKAYAQEQKALKEKIYRKLQSPMDLLKELVSENIVRCDRTKYLTSFVEVMRDIPKGIKADYNRIREIKKVCLEAKRSQDYVQSEYNAGRRSFDEMYEEKKKIEKDVINNIMNRNVTTWDIHKLIRDVHDTHPEKDKHGKIVKDEKGKPKIVDKRDKDLMDAEVGGLLLQWVYAAHKEKFLETIKSSGYGTVSYVAKYEPENDTSNKVKSLKDLGKLLNNNDDKIFELDGEKYIIKCHKKASKKVS